LYLPLLHHLTYQVSFPTLGNTQI